MRMRTLALGGGLLLAACGSQAPEPEAPPPLPTGRLQLVTSGVTESRFLSLDDLRRGDGAAQATVLIVGATGTAIGKTYAMMLKRETIDCAAGRTTAETAAYFDAAGRLMHQEVINTGRMGRPLEPAEVEANVACGTASKGPLVNGWRGAQRAVQSPTADYVAAARADDFDAQAWICAATVRGRLKPPQPEACGRAVALNGAELGVRLDHGYVSLVSNELATAKADFDAVIAADPRNAAAYFGRSLIPAIRGDPAAGAADRAAALALDPKVSQAVEATYKVHVGDAYR